MAGVDIRTVQELLDHKTSTVTMRCAHLAPKHTLAAVISVRMLNYPWCQSGVSGAFCASIQTLVAVLL